MAAVDILRAARARIEDPKNWTRGELARNADGVCVPPSDAGATCWCALGALNAGLDCQYDQWNRANRLLADAAFSLFGSEVSIAEVNDRIGHAAVLRVYDVAIAAAEAEAGR